MKNKILVSFMAIALLTFFSVTLTSCGGEDEDPKPIEKTDLQKVQEAVAGSTWTLVSIDITKGGVTETFNGGCDESNLSTWAQANAVDIDFNFTSATSVTEVLSCSSTTVVVSYTISESLGKFYITTSNGFSFELLTTPDEVEGNQIEALIVTPKNDGITSAKWRFSK